MVKFAVTVRSNPKRPDRLSASAAAPAARATKNAMTTIAQEDLIQSVADALQFISYYHPADYIEALGEAYEAEESPAAKDAIAQILTNSRMCAEGHRPICQDTGIVVAFVKVGMDVRWDDATMSVADMVNEGVRRAYLDPDNTLRASIVARSRRQAQEHEGQHAGGRPLRARAGRHGRRAASRPRAAAPRTSRSSRC